MANVQIPVYSWFAPYKSGLELTFVSTTEITVALGDCTDSTRQNIINLVAPVNIFTNVTGAGGIDTGVLSASTFYAVYAIASSSNPVINEQYTEAVGANALNPYPPSALISKSYTSPILPVGYDMFRYIGSVLTDGSSHILAFLQNGSEMFYDIAISVLNGGTSATYANVDVSTAIPAPGLKSYLKVSVTPTAAGDTVEVLPYGITETNGILSLSGSVAAVAQEVDYLSVLTGSNSGAAYLQYKVTGTTSLSVQGYLDSNI